LWDERFPCAAQLTPNITSPENLNPLMRYAVVRNRIQLAQPVQKRRTSMKTSLTLLPFISALSVPSALAAELAGIDLPTMIAPTQLFAAFVIVLVTQIAWADYGRNSRRLSSPQRVPGATRSTRAAHPLAA
jgi:hypothetical protein